MKTLQIDEKKARQLYPTASSDFKAVLEDSFGKEFFSQKITDRVKSFEDACEVLGIDAASVYSSADTKDESAYKKLKVIAMALNEGWQPNWSDKNQRKWFPWFQFKDSAFGFSCAYCDDWSAGAFCGSRLCFKSSELAEYAGKQFQTIYNDFLNL